MSKTIKLHDKYFAPYIDANKIDTAIKELAQKIQTDYQGKRPIFVGILNGSFLFAADLVREFDGECEVSFIKMASYEGTTTTGVVNELIGLKEDIEGRHIVLVEDIVDTGNTLEKLHEELKKKNPASIEIATLLFKPKAYQKNFPVKYVAIEVGNEFLVGYGLDYDGLGRNLKDIYIITKQPNKMLNIVLFGPPGAGKGTQSDLLKSKFDMVHISTGDVFRALDPASELGKLAKSYADNGNLVPDEITIKILQEEVSKHPDAKGVIYDGFPRTTAQAEALDKFLASKDASVSMMLSLVVPEEELKKRLIARAEVSGRKDDADPAIIQNRIDTYNKSTAPVADFYNAQNKLVEINGVGSIEDISNELFAAVQKAL